MALYYETPYETCFQATLVSSEERDGKWNIELDRTLFYPEGGGQPADRGSLNGIAVLDVRKVDKRIIHITEKKPESSQIRGEVDSEKPLPLYDSAYGTAPYFGGPEADGGYQYSLCSYGRREYNNRSGLIGIFIRGE